MAVQISPCVADLKTASWYPPGLFDNVEQDHARATFAKSLSELSTAKDCAAFGKTLTGSTCATDDQDFKNDLLLDIDNEDDRSPWASAACNGELSFSFEDQGDGEFEIEAENASDPLPSQGSRLHESKTCKPCAWFWKSGGCQNGRECLHCHLCPQGAVKARKKENLRQMKAAAAAAGAGGENELGNLEELQPATTMAFPSFESLQPMLAPTLTATTFRPPPGLPPPQAPMLIPPTLDVQYLFGQPASAGHKNLGDRMLQDSDDESTADESIPAGEQLDISDSQSEVQSSSSDDLRSVGSRFHASGACKPCSWFWRAGGCQNGSDCLHCHMCPEGEIKLRKKQKAAIARKQFGDQLTCTKEPLAADAADQKAEHGAVAEVQLQATLVQQQLVIQHQQQQLMQMQIQLCFRKKQMQLLANQPIS